MPPFESDPHRYVVWLNRDIANRELVGGKAASLSYLAALGAPVPIAFALTTHAYAEFAHEHGLPRRAADVATDELPQLRASILAAPLPDSIASSLAKGFQALATQLGNDIALAVRSSGTAEDSAAHSFAGLHETVLDVRTLSSLEAAVRQCWASLWSERAVAYRWECGDLASEASEIAVVVQQLVRSDVSFVAFTADPVSQVDDHVVIDATWGLGEAIVSGLVVPDHITIDGHGQVVQYVVGDKHLMVIPGDRSLGGTREVAAPRALRSVPALTHDQAREIARTARSLALKLEFEADIEGGIADGAIHLFQARPITTLAKSQVANQRPEHHAVRELESFAVGTFAPAPYETASKE